VHAGRTAGKRDDCGRTQRSTAEAASPSNATKRSFRPCCSWPPPGCGSDRRKSPTIGVVTGFLSTCVPYCKKELSCHPQLSQVVGDCKAFCNGESRRSAG